MTRDEAIRLVEDRGARADATASKRIVLALEALGLIRFDEQVQAVPNLGPAEINETLLRLLRSDLAALDPIKAIREDLEQAGIALVKTAPGPFRFNVLSTGRDNSSR